MWPDHNSFTPQFHPQVSTRWVMHTKGLGLCLAPKSPAQGAQGQPKPGRWDAGSVGREKSHTGKLFPALLHLPHSRVGNAEAAWVGATCTISWNLQQPGQSLMLEGLPAPLPTKKNKNTKPCLSWKAQPNSGWFRIVLGHNFSGIGLVA